MRTPPNLRTRIEKSVIRHDQRHRSKTIKYFTLFAQTLYYFLFRLYITIAAMSCIYKKPNIRRVMIIDRDTSNLMLVISAGELLFLRRRPRLGACVHLLLEGNY